MVRKVIISVLLFFITLYSSFGVSILDSSESITHVVDGDLDLIEDILDEKDAVDVIVWLNGNEFTSSDFQDLAKKRFEIRSIQDKVLSQLSSKDFKLKYRYTVTNGFSGAITATGFEKLKSNENVASIFLDREVKALLRESRPLVRGDKVENNFGITGRGVGICVIDSGIDYTHSSLGGCFGGNCKVVDGYDFVNFDNDPMDDSGHGTHVAGIAASYNSIYRGLAPDASLIALKVLNFNNIGSLGAVAAGIDWCVNNTQRLSIKVITMSLGTVGFRYSDSNCLQTINPFIQSAFDAGIFIDASSGNDAFTDGIWYPACAPGVTSVGAVYDAAVGPKGWGVCFDSNTAADKIVCFTNRASNLDVLAPGAIINSTTSHLGSHCGASLQNGFRSCSGTSMAAPHVAGIAALMFQKYPNLKPAEIERILKDSGKSIFDSKTSLNFSRVDAYAAIVSLKPEVNIELSVFIPP